MNPNGISTWFDPDPVGVVEPEPLEKLNHGSQASYQRVSQARPSLGLAKCVTDGVWAVRVEKLHVDNLSPNRQPGEAS